MRIGGLVADFGLVMTFPPGITKGAAAPQKHNRVLLAQLAEND